MGMPGTGIDVYLANSSPIVLIAQVERVGGVGALSRPTLEIPATSEEYMRYIDGGKVLASPIEIGLAWDPSEASYTTLRGLLDSGTAIALRFVLTDTGAEVVNLTAFLTELSNEYTHGELARATVTLQPTSSDGATNPYSFT